MSKQVFERGPQSAEVCKRVERTVTYGRGPTTPHGTTTTYRWMPVARRTAEITVEIDLEQIARTLGERAMLSKGRKSQAMNGAVVVRARAVQDEAIEGAVERVAQWIATGEVQA